MVFLRSLLSLFIVFLGVCTGADRSFAETRVALVIGNSAYKDAPLRNPVNDAVDVAAALKRAGFETIVAKNASRAAMEAATIQFARAVQTADVAMFYYSGHAFQFGGVNYLVPIDGEVTDQADLRLMIKVDDIKADLLQAKTLRILVLDSCRNNPFAKQLQRSVRALPLERGMARIEAPEGMIVAFATQAGQTADDGDGHNSPYTTAFLKHIDEKEEISTVFRHISADVYASTKPRQLPELSLSMIGDFYLQGKVDVTGQPDPCVGASDHWRSAEAIGNLAALEDHLARYPTCAFAGLAKARIEMLKSNVALVVPPPVAADKLRRDLVTDCDLLAGLPASSEGPTEGVGTLEIENIDTVRARGACDDAVRQYPDVARFVTLAGRVALAQHDYVSARQKFEQAIGMGSATAMTSLGAIYEYGDGVGRDYTKARQWYEKAADKGDAGGIHNLGLLYEDGKGVDQDYTKARQLHEKAADKGEANSMGNLGLLYENGRGVDRDYTKARQWFERAADKGEATSMTNLGWLYQNGNGVEQNYAKARQWYEKAAEQGQADAMGCLGWLYASGKGVDRDDTKARQWYQKAADKGNATAMANLAVSYENGLGGERNLAQARKWYEKAAAAGEEFAKTWLQNQESQGSRKRKR